MSRGLLGRALLRQGLLRRSGAARGIRTRSAVAGLVVLGLLGFGAGYHVFAPEQAGQAERAASGAPGSPEASLGINVDAPELREIALQSHAGLATSWGDFSGAPRLVFFGYTYCPDICPLGLSRLADVVDILDASGQRVEPIFISVDPERDTPEMLRAYVEAFHDRLVGLTGPDTQLRQLAAAFLAYYETDPATAGDEDYLIDHTSFTYLVGASGELLGYYPMTMEPDALAAAVGKDLAGG